MNLFSPWMVSNTCYSFFFISFEFLLFPPKHAGLSELFRIEVSSYFNIFPENQERIKKMLT